MFTVGPETELPSAGSGRWRRHARPSAPHSHIRRLLCARPGPGPETQTSGPCGPVLGELPGLWGRLTRRGTSTGGQNNASGEHRVLGAGEGDTAGDGESRPEPLFRGIQGKDPETSPGGAFASVFCRNQGFLSLNAKVILFPPNPQCYEMGEFSHKRSAAIAGGGCRLRAFPSVSTQPPASPRHLGAPRAPGCKIGVPWSHFNPHSRPARNVPSACLSSTRGN